MADFGDRAWPRHPIAAFSQDWTTKQLWNIMTELAWRLVDYVTVKCNGKAACQIAVPLLDPVPGYRSPNYATSTSWSAAPGAPLLTGFVLCVWAVYEAHGGPGAPELAIMSVHSVEESGGDEGVTWWSRACNTDREAIIILDNTAAVPPNPGVLRCTATSGAAWTGNRPASQALLCAPRALR